MRRKRIHIGICAALAVVPFIVLSVAQYQGTNPRPDSQSKGNKNSKSKEQRLTEARSILTHRNASFIANHGQWDERVRYFATTRSGGVSVTDDGWVLGLKKGRLKTDSDRILEDMASRGTVGHEIAEQARSSEMVVETSLRLRFVDANEKVCIEAEAKTPHIHHYFLGSNQSQWRTQVPSFGAIHVSEMYAGVDVRLRTANEFFEYDILLKPGADLSQVAIQCEGSEGLRIGKDGNLKIRTPLGAVTQHRPKTWQVRADGTKQEVRCRFVVLAEDLFGFHAEGWDSSLALCIDPVFTANWSSYHGAAGDDIIYDLSYYEFLDPNPSRNFEKLYVCGTTSSGPNLPGATWQYGSLGRTDAFVTLIDNASSPGTAVRTATAFIGHTQSDEEAKAIMAAPQSGPSSALDVAIAGWTTNGTTFPGLNRFQTSGFGGRDAFVTILSQNLQTVRYSTAFGGSQDDEAEGVTLDPGGTKTVTFAGGTFSTTTQGFSTTTNAHFPNHAGTASNSDAFLTQLDTSRTPANQLIYSTYLGGSKKDKAWDLSLYFRSSPFAKFYAIGGETRSANVPVGQTQFPLIDTSPPSDNILRPAGQNGFLAILDLNTDPGQFAVVSIIGGPSDQELILGIDGDQTLDTLAFCGWTSLSTPNKPAVPTDWPSSSGLPGLFAIPVQPRPLPPPLTGIKAMVGVQSWDFNLGGAVFGSSWGIDLAFDVSSDGYNDPTVGGRLSVDVVGRSYNAMGATFLRDSPPTSLPSRPEFQASHPPGSARSAFYVRFFGDAWTWGGGPPFYAGIVASTANGSVDALANAVDKELAFFQLPNLPLGQPNGPIGLGKWFLAGNAKANLNTTLPSSNSMQPAHASSWDGFIISVDR